MSSVTHTQIIHLNKYGTKCVINCDFLFCFVSFHFHRYLDENNLLDALPLEQWYGTCFAGILTNQSIIRIWDKICGGSRKIVVFVFVTIFNWIWRTTKLSSATQVSEILTIIDNVSVWVCMFAYKRKLLLHPQRMIYFLFFFSLYIPAAKR